MPLPSPSTLHEPQTYLPQYFEPAPELLHLLAARPEQFFIVRVEEMYRHVRGPVPAVRSAAHTALFITSGAARLAVGYDHYTVRPDELLLVPAGQIHSFGPGDVNTGYLCHFHPDLLRRSGTTEPEFLTGWGYPRLGFAPGAAAFVRVLLERMLTVYEREELAALAVLLAHLAALLAEAGRAYPPPPGASPTAATTLSQAFKNQEATEPAHPARAPGGREGRSPRALRQSLGKS